MMSKLSSVKPLKAKNLHFSLLSSNSILSNPNPKRMPTPSLIISGRMLPSLLLLLLTSSYSAAADNSSPAIFLSVCVDNQTQNAEAFDVNFVDAMGKIYQNVTTSGFATSSSGSTLTVYGLGQCFNYLSPVNCQLCYSQSRVKLPHCLPATAGRIYLDGCFLEYADRNVSSHAIDSADAYACGNTTVDKSLQLQFVNRTSDLVGSLSMAYQEEEYYQVGSVQVSPDLTVYGMAQCWRSLNASGCRNCLEKGKDNILDRCFPSMEAKAMNAGCFLRYSTEPFYLHETVNGSGSHWSSAKRSVIIAVTTVLGALIVVGLVLLWKKRSSAFSYSEGVSARNQKFMKSIIKSHLSYKYVDLCKATSNFSPNNKLGQGGFGAVYKGVLLDGKEIAVKRLFFNTNNWVDHFFNEVKLISQVQHKNLVKLLGCSVEGPESLLVYELLSNSSLDHYLFDSFMKTALDWERRLNLIVGVAEGLAYLHHASPVRIIHRDIKASNILLDDMYRPKISDFGLARYFAEDQGHLSTGIAGTFGYMAPEYIIHGQLTEKVDIYSYGILVLEILTGHRNQRSILASEDQHSLLQQIWQHHNSETLIMMLDPDLQGKCSEVEAIKTFKVGLLCVQASPSMRPPMWKVVEILTSGRNNLSKPTQPPFLQRHDPQQTQRHTLGSTPLQSAPI